MQAATSIQTVEIEVADLRLGMYVTELDRPWTETPFPFQGFRITEQAEVDALKRYCSRVRIDIVAGDPPQAKTHTLMSDGAAVRSNQIFGTGTARRTDIGRPASEEMASAAAARHELVQSLSEVMDGLRAGHPLALDQVKASTRPLVDSIERNPDAAAWLMTMRRKDAGLHRNAMTAAVLVLTCGRHLGLPRPALESLALGGLMFDVGKTRIPDAILLKPDRLTEVEFAAYKRHVEYGVEILSGCKGVNEAVLSMVSTHHERHDGSGYPLGLTGDSIPAFGKLAGIVDAYLTMLESPTAGRPLSAHDVLNYLNMQRGGLFDAPLVEEFIQAIGIYPTGTLVKLSDGHVGVVVEQNRLRRLKPKVMLIVAPDGQRLPAFDTVDLIAYTAGGNAVHIVECLPAGAYGIDPEELFL